MSGVTFRPAPAVERVAKKLIGKYHTDLEEVDVRYVFRSEHAKSSGKAVFGRAKKVSGLNAYLAANDAPDETGIEGSEGDFFVIEIAEDIWRELKQDARVALVDHELSHCGTTYDKDENLKLVTKPHDLEEFNAIVERHGLWRPDVAEFDQALRLNFAAGSPDHVEEEVASHDVTDALLNEELVKEHMGENATVTRDGDTVTITVPLDEAETSSSSTESEPVSEAAPPSDDPLDGTQEASAEANGAEDQGEAAVDEMKASTDTDTSGGPDAAPSGPQPATPAQRLALGRHIAALDEALTNEFMEWCRKKKVPLNPQEMTFDQARAALILVGEREPAATT